MGKNQIDRLVGLRDPRRMVEGYAVRFHMNDLRGLSFVLFGPRRILGALQIKFHFAAADDAPGIPLVLATFRVDRIVPRPSISKNCDGHVFHQARRLVLKVRGFQRFHRENLPVAYDFRKR